MPRAALALVLVLAAAACQGASTIPKSELSRLVLQPRDLPAGFVQFDTGAQVRLDNASGPRSNEERYGREGGWKARYQRSGTTKGPLVVESRADLFPSSGDGRRDLALYRQELKGAPGAKLLDPPKLGDEAVAATSVQPALKPLRTYRIAWRTANATASVLVQGFDGQLELADALALARAQQKHLSAAVQ
jgi:hypothetical protein